MNKTLSLFLIACFLTSWQAQADLKACLIANTNALPNANQICDVALQSSGLSLDDKSKIYITQAAYLILKNEFNAANESLEIAFNSNPKMLENGEYRYNWLRTKGTLYFTKEEFVSALPFFERAVKVAEIMDSKRTIANSYNDLGATYLELDNYTEALIWLKRSLEMHQKENNLPLMAASNANIAEIYLITREQIKALEYFNAAINLLKTSISKNPEQKDSRSLSLAKIFVSIADLYLSEKQYTEALHNLQEAYKIYKNLNITGKQVSVLSEIGKLYLEQSKIDNAMEFLLRAQSLEETLESQDNLDFRQILVDAYVFKKEWDNAEKLAVDGLRKAVINKNSVSQIGFLNSLSKIYENQQQWQKSIKFLKQNQQLKEDILESKYDNSRLKLLTEIEVSQKQRQLEALQEQKLIRELEVRKQQLIFIVGGLFLLGLVTYLLFKLNRKKAIDKTIRLDKSTHTKELIELSFNKQDLKHLFNGMDCRIICFDTTGVIYFNSDENEIIQTKLELVLPNVWDLLTNELNQDELLEKDLYYDQNTLGNDNSVWIHQIKQLDNLLVCMIFDQYSNKEHNFSYAENIRKYSEFKQQLSNLITYTQSMTISDILNVNHVTLAIKTIKQDTDLGSLETVTSHDFKIQLVDLMVMCVDIWQQNTAKTTIDLAEKSGLWRVSNEEGQLRTRTMNRYTDIEKIPNKPRWLQVVKTAHFVLSDCDLNIQQRQLLNEKAESIKNFMRNRALGY